MPGDLITCPYCQGWLPDETGLIAHLGAAIMQSIPKDDQIIMDHVQAAHEIAKIVRRKA